MDQSEVPRTERGRERFAQAAAQKCRNSMPSAILSEGEGWKRTLRRRSPQGGALPHIREAQRGDRHRRRRDCALDTGQWNHVGLQRPRYLNNLF